MGRRPGRRRRPAAQQALTLAVLALVAAALGVLGYLLLVYPRMRHAGRGRELEVDLRGLIDTDDVAATLASNGVIDSPRAFAMYASLMDAAAHWRGGTVVLADDLAPRDVLLRITTGLGDASVRVVIPEGFHRFDVATRLARYGVCDRDAFLRATEDRTLIHSLGIPADTAEGYLFPDTYELRQNTPAEQVVRKLVATFDRRVGALWHENGPRLDTLRTRLAMTPHGVLVLASIVEKEAHAKDERPIIAGVFLNRLASATFRPRGRLQADPTAAYGCLVARTPLASCAGFDGKHVTPAMVGDANNPYNTYHVTGLPPGPICNPGLASIRAVLEPARHDFFYFVTSGGGRHRFSETYEAHTRAVEASP